MYSQKIKTFLKNLFLKVHLIIDLLYDIILTDQEVFI